MAQAMIIVAFAVEVVDRILRVMSVKDLAKLNPLRIHQHGTTVPIVREQDITLVGRVGAMEPKCVLLAVGMGINNAGLSLW